MIKTKDGYAKLIGAKYSGDLYSLLKSDGNVWEVNKTINNEVDKIVRTDSSGVLPLDKVTVKTELKLSDKAANINRVGFSGPINQGRDRAVIKTTTYLSNSTLYSIKTTSGSWDMAVTSNKLNLHYISDGYYSGDSGDFYTLTFPENTGTLALTTDIPIFNIIAGISKGVQASLLKDPYISLVSTLGETSKSLGQVRIQGVGSSVVNSNSSNGIIISGTLYKAGTGLKEESIDATSITGYKTTTISAKLDFETTNDKYAVLANSNGLYVQVPWRTIKIKGTSINRYDLNLIEGDNITLSNSLGEVKISAKDTLYAAGKGLSLSTTTFNINAGADNATERLYGVKINDENKLYVKVPWKNTEYSAGDGIALDKTSYIFSHKDTSTATENIQYGPTANVTGSDSKIIKVPYLKIDTYGHVTSLGEREYTSKDTTYTFKGGTNSFTVTPLGKDATTINITPAITNNVVYSGDLTINLVAIFSSTDGKIKSSGFTIGSDVPKGALFTDTKVTSVDNHYEPKASTTAALTAKDGTVTNLASNELQVVVGLKRDSKGHVTDIVSKGIKTTYDSLKNPKALKIKANTTEVCSYFGDEEKTVTLKVKNNLDISAENGTITIDGDHTHNYAGSSSAGGAANSVAKSLIIKTGDADTEGTNLYTYNGSTAKTLNIASGSNISIAATSGKLTINATDTTYGADRGISLESNKFGHSNSITKKSTYVSESTKASANGGTIKVTDVKYDAYGHISGSQDRTITLSQDHTKTTVTKGTAGTSEPTEGASLNVPYIEINSDGHITKYGTHKHTIKGFLTSEEYKGTVTSITPGIGLTGTSSDVAITGSGTINLKAAKTDELGGIKLGYSESGKKYAVKLDTANKAYVEVPWLSSDMSNYLPLSGGTMTDSIITPANNDLGIIPKSNNLGLIGSATKKFYRMYASTFYGDLSGTADSADYHNYSYGLPGIIWVGELYRNYRSSTMWYATRKGGEAEITLDINNATAENGYQLKINCSSSHVILGAMCSISALFNADKEGGAYSEGPIYASDTYNVNKIEEAGTEIFVVSVRYTGLHIKALRASDDDNTSYYFDGFAFTGKGKDSNSLPLARVNLIIIGY